MDKNLPMGLTIADIDDICGLAKKTMAKELKEWFGDDPIALPILSTAIVRHVLGAAELILWEKANSEEIA